MTSASAWSSVPPAARAKTTCESTSATRRAGRTTGADEPVVTALARIERGSDEERAAKATRRLAACGFSSVPSWMRPYRCLSNGEAARADVAVAIAVSTRTISIGSVWSMIYACVVNRDAAMSMACAIGKYARRERLTGLVLATAHEDCCAYLQPDWILDSATGAMTRRPGPARSPVVTWECDWSGCPMSTNWKTPPPAERRGTRNTDLVREISNTYDVTPEAIEKDRPRRRRAARRGRDECDDGPRRGNGEPGV